MMVPRAFAHNTLAQQRFGGINEKDAWKSNNTRQGSSDSRRSSIGATSLSKSASDTALDARSTPVKIPLRSTKNTPKNAMLQSVPVVPHTNPQNSERSSQSFRRRESAQEILSATAIPIRRRPKQRTSQRLPNCDYVTDFSKLLMEDVKNGGDGSLASSLNNPQFDGLFGNIDELLEGQMFVGSDGLDAGILSTRSISTDSMPSLVSPDDFSAATSIVGRSTPEKRPRQMASSEDCATAHPLLATQEEEEDGQMTPESFLSASPKRTSMQMSSERRRNAFKSSLTASLNAIKTAAKSVSHLAATPPLIQPDDFLTHSFFDFQPSLTDDRRPPPLAEPPSPALRRYLNPQGYVPPDSPVQLHFWLDDKPASSATVTARAIPKSRLKNKRKAQTTRLAGKDKSELPPIVPLATCIPSTIRTAHASSPPIWLAPDGTPSNKRTAPMGPVPEVFGCQPRQREPRENRDFLRVFVCELNMRRSGKLSEDAQSKATLWLPPLQDLQVDQSGTNPRDANNAPTWPNKSRKYGVERWTVWNIDDL